MSFLCFEFSLTVVSISSKISSIPESLFSVSCILLVLLASVATDLFHRCFISRVASIYVSFIVSISTFRSSTALFNSFTCVFLFYFFYFKGLISFLFKCFYLFTCVFLYFFQCIIYILLKRHYYLH
jgi:hypothetical protein